jgi:hypothetical protein
MQRNNEAIYDDGGTACPFKKIYLAGPMRGYPLFNFPAFELAATHLRKLGFEVWSPAENDVEVDGFDPAKPGNCAKTMSHYMQRDLPAVCNADAVALLPGWQKSEGANLEVYVARKLGKHIVDAETLQPVSGEGCASGGEVTIVDEKTGGKKGQKLARFDLIPAHALEEIACVYGRGAQKYSDDNWRKGYSWRLSFGALMRHAWAFWRGEERDELGNHHLACVAWHCFTMMTFERFGLGTDDRPDKQKSIFPITIDPYKEEAANSILESMTLRKKIHHDSF